MNKIIIKDAYVISHGTNDNLQTYLVEFDLLKDSIENVELWKKFFDLADKGNKLRLTIEIV